MTLRNSSISVVRLSSITALTPRSNKSRWTDKAKQSRLSFRKSDSQQVTSSTVGYQPKSRTPEPLLKVRHLVGFTVPKTPFVFGNDSKI